jgi:hypothetical protein
MKAEDSKDEFRSSSPDKEEDKGITHKKETLKKLRKYQKSIEPDEYDEYYRYNTNSRY